jgi:hypothetical protein
LREVRQLAARDPGVVLAVVTEYYGLEAGALTRRHDRHIARSVAAWLCPRHTGVTLSELAVPLGQSRADTVRSLVRRMEARLRSSPQLAEDVKAMTWRAKHQRLNSPRLLRYVRAYSPPGCSGPNRLRVPTIFE